MNQAKLKDLCNDLAYEIADHSFDEVHDPETLAEIIYKFLKGKV
jgi:hypothetical protein